MPSLFSLEIIENHNKPRISEKWGETLTFLVLKAVVEELGDLGRDKQVEDGNYHYCLNKLSY